METFIPILIAIILFSISLFFFIRSNQNQPNTNKKKRQKFYTDKETTPLIFHEINVYALIPISVLYEILLFIIAMLSSEPDSTFYMIFYLIVVPLHISLCYFLAKFKPVGWYINNICIALVLIDSLLLIGSLGLSIEYYYDIENLLIEMISPIVRIIMSILVFIYYYKRKSLFIPSKERKTEETTMIPLVDNIENNENQENITPTLNTSTKPKKFIPIFVLSILCLSILCNIFLLYRTINLSNMYEESRKNAKAYYDAYLNQKFEYDEIQSEYEFYHQYAVITEVDSNTYHCYGCEKLKNKSFYIFNIENAYAQGYYPCPVCMKTSSN